MKKSFLCAIFLLNLTCTNIKNVQNYGFKAIYTAIDLKVLDSILCLGTDNRYIYINILNAKEQNVIYDTGQYELNQDTVSFHAYYEGFKYGGLLEIDPKYKGVMYESYLDVMKFESKPGTKFKKAKKNKHLEECLEIQSQIEENIALGKVTTSIHEISPRPDYEF